MKMRKKYIMKNQNILILLLFINNLYENI